MSFVTVDLGIFTQSVICACDFPVSCNASTTEVVSSDYPVLGVFGLEGMIVIGVEFVTWQSLVGA